MSEELENLLNMALADGEVTEKERSIIVKKAIALGLDQDEVEMILDGKIALMKKEANLNNSVTEKPKSQKHGDYTKCPSCGAPVTSFSTKCFDCGHEFRNIEINKSVKSFFEEFNNIEKIITADYYNAGKDKNGVELGGWFGKLMNIKPTNVIEFEINKIVSEKRINLITTYEVPNSKDEVLHFLAISVSEARKKSEWVMGSDLNKLKDAYKSKAISLIFKARLLFKDDKDTLNQVNDFAKQLKI